MLDIEGSSPGLNLGGGTIFRVVDTVTSRIFKPEINFAHTLSAIRLRLNNDRQELT